MAADNDPFARFGRWLSKAKANEIIEHNAMVLSTVDRDGQPSSRVVLLKELDERGFVFYTNLESRKGLELAGNPKASLNFFWRPLDRQVVVRGVAERVDDEAADAYFATRARGSQLGAWASAQTRPLPSRTHLLADVARYEGKFLGRSVPRPDHWSGYRIVPSTIEFWVRGLFRLHDRTLYERAGDGWTKTTLYP